MVAVPSQYQSQVKWAAGVIGIPPAVVAAQINAESGFQPGVNSSAGAEGIAQFLPSTWQGLGCTGSPYDPNSAFKCYAKYMYQLVQQEHGNVRNALAAYNAGPGNLAAGYGYADSILSAAGASPGLQAGGGSGTGAGTGSTPGATLTDATLGGTCLGTTFPHTSWCLKKATARHIMGGALMAAGGLIAMPGVLLLAAFAFRSAGGLGRAANVAAVVPGGQGVAAGLQAAQGRAGRTGSQALSARRAGQREEQRRVRAGDREQVRAVRAAQPRRAIYGERARPRTTRKIPERDTGTYEGTLPS